MNLRSFLGAALAGIVIIACTTAEATPSRVNVSLLAGTPDSLFVRVQFTPGTVANPDPTTPVTTRILWTVNGVGEPIRMGIPGSADTLRTGRCLAPCADTVAVNLASDYQGRVGPSVGTSAIFLNTDLQIPSTPTIIQVDSL